MRILTILRAQLSERDLRATVKLAKRALFCNDEIRIFAFDFSSQARAQAANRGPVDVRKGTIGEIERHATGLDPVPWELQCHRFDGVSDFYTVTTSGGELQHISWVYYPKDPNRFVRLQPGDAEIKYCLTLPSFRGRGIYPRALMEIAAHLAAAGIRRVFICAQFDNHASMRGIEKAGFVEVGRIQLLKVMGVQISRRFDPHEGSIPQVAKGSIP